MIHRPLSTGKVHNHTLERSQKLLDNNTIYTLGLRTFLVFRDLQLKETRTRRKRQ